MRNEKMENINGYQCKVYTANHFELVTRSRVEHMSADDRKAYEAGHPSHKNFLGGVMNFLESSASSSKSPSSGTASASASASASKSSSVRNSQQIDEVTVVCVDDLQEPAKHSSQPAVTLEEYFNSRVDLKNRDIGRPREENIKVQTFNAQLSLCDDYPLRLQEQILPIIDLMAIRYGCFSLRRSFAVLPLDFSNSHFKKLRDFVTLQLPNGFPVKIRKTDLIPSRTDGVQSGVFHRQRFHCTTFSPLK